MAVDCSFKGDKWVLMNPKTDRKVWQSDENFPKLCWIQGLYINPLCPLSEVALDGYFFPCSVSKQLLVLRCLVEKMEAGTPSEVRMSPSSPFGTFMYIIPTPFTHMA